jgi:hypothetical protein
MYSFRRFELLTSLTHALDCLIFFLWIDPPQRLDYFPSSTDLADGTRKANLKLVREAPTGKFSQVDMTPFPAGYRGFARGATPDFEPGCCRARAGLHERLELRLSHQVAGLDLI